MIQHRAIYISLPDNLFKQSMMTLWEAAMIADEKNKQGGERIKYIRQLRALNTERWNFNFDACNEFLNAVNEYDFDTVSNLANSRLAELRAAQQIIYPDED